MIMRLRRAAALAAALLLPSACTVGPDYVAPAPTAAVGWTETAGRPGFAVGADSAEALERWWAAFGDPVLDRLVQRAVRGNYDLRIATERIEQARADRTIAAAGLYPSLGLTASSQRQRVSQASKFPPPGFVELYTTHQLALEASWEPDLFGKIRRSVEAADATLGGTVENRRAVLVSLLGELASDYAMLRAAQLRIDIARRNLAAQNEIVGLTQERAKHGLGSELEVAQAASQLASLYAVVPQLQTSEAQSLHALAVLLGQEPGGLDQDLRAPGKLPPVPPVVPVSLPSQVVRGRPDIRAAERSYAVANAEIGVAVAQLFPDFTLTPTSLGVQSATLGKLLTSGAVLWSFGLQAAQPIFQGGRLTAQVQRARSVAAERKLTYEKTVLTAFQEVEDALVALAAERERRRQLGLAVEASRLALRRATEAWRGGFADFLTVLDAQRTLYAAEDNLAQSELALLQQTIGLYRAFGGGWQATEADVPPATGREGPKAR